ncbi:MAG: GTP-binding protein TypA [Candidatus Levybacteria bacterium RIFCSPHIGHO2_01_FULL_36_15]|nr:MAG: GTP-binding protein TypA [Candidatus Levybacteria bacterium RIFCSPHIGHO2_01_FULL_36_15]OGH38591.1 MAG: GTP-binding protein TypA [Candidatus Levybacteria bacterium RIFCSPLOWO2_01_FULL_36_10]
MEIKNIAIIAHVDHGKTTLVDAMLKQTHTFRANQKEMNESLIMDSNDLEKEKGITILAKNTSVFYKEVKINIIDTPGHADFGGEVERVINMASAALLLVDAAEGPLPQTKFVLKKALESGLKIILVINKIDKKDARPAEVINEVENLFLELAQNDSALNFSILYAVGRDGKAYFDLPEGYTAETQGDLTPLFETILKVVPNSAVHEDKPFQMLVSTLDYDNYSGRICIGKINQGTLRKGDSIALIDDNKITGTYKVQKLYTSVGLARHEVEEITSGDIVGIAGIPDLTIGETVSDPKFPYSLPKIILEEPTIKVTIGPNTSPLSGREGKFCSSAQIKQRLLKEKEINLGLRIEEDTESSNFIVAGRGELHLSILIETMRRENFELQVSKPQVIYKTINGALCEPFEEATIDVSSEFIGVVTEEMSKRKGQMVSMANERNNTTRFVYKVSSQNLLGLRNSLLTKTKGTAIINTYFLGYFPKSSVIMNMRNGALVAIEAGKALSYGLENAEARGVLFVGSGTEVYEGMVVGISNREDDIDINVCKGKKLTNIRSSTSDIAIQLTPAVILSLEQALDLINEDELLEVTPQSIRIRKRYLSLTKRRVAQRKIHDQTASAI